MDLIPWSDSLHGADVDCSRHRRQIQSWLALYVPDIVLITNKEGYPLADKHGALLPPDKREARWQKGLALTLGALPPSEKAIVLADTPYPGDLNVPACLRAPRDRISDCVQSRNRMVAAAHATAERKTTEAAGATFASLTGQICSYGPCPVIIDEQLLWRDHSHLTATYSTALAPSLGAVLDAVVSGP